MKKFFYLLLVVMLVASCKNDGGESIEINVDGVSFKMIKVKGGTFQMGSENGEEDEQPIHSVTLSDYYIGETEVTQALWQAVMGSNPSEFEGDNLPVEMVNWDDCQKFISKLNQMTGKTFALPTEAQWEYAARGGNKSQGYEYSGSNNIDDVAWYWDNSSEQTHPVGTKMANELGLYDMSGNVLEWCSDWYGDYSSSSQTDPTGSSTGSLRVLRGGSWRHDASDCCSTYRGGGNPDSRYYLNGFRLVLLDGQPEEPQIEATVTIQSDKAVLNVNGIVANLLKVDGGTFQMGSENWTDWEKPVHSVTLSGYYIGETEVTQALWEAVMGTTVRQQRNKADTSWSIYGEGDNYPMYYISWNECQDFISKLNQKTGRRFALPTEAQWEFAARGGNKSRGYEYSGSNNIDEVAWYWDNSSEQTHPVGTKMANELGLYDMSGNVWECCSDWYGDYSSSSQTNPTGASTGSSRVLRGGSWSDNASFCRSAFRIDNYPDTRSRSHGFRLVLLF